VREKHLKFLVSDEINCPGRCWMNTNGICTPEKGKVITVFEQSLFEVLNFVMLDSRNFSEKICFMINWLRIFLT
jgi:hypothetical protein